MRKYLLQFHFFEGNTVESETVTFLFFVNGKPPLFGTFKKIIFSSSANCVGACRTLQKMIFSSSACVRGSLWDFGKIYFRCLPLMDPCGS